MSNLVNIFEGLLNENPNLAIKFLKEKGYDPTTDSRGKKLLDDILAFTRGDGYTALMVRFEFNERKPIAELIALYQYIKTNKEILSKLPKPILNYQTTRELQNDIDSLETERKFLRVIKQVSPDLRNQLLNLDAREKIELRNLSSQFLNLDIDKQKHFMKKVFGYHDVKTFIDNFKSYIHEVQSQQDYESIITKIEATDGAELVYIDREKEIIIASIQTFPAMKALGCTSAWCITRDLSRFRQYKVGGKHYFFIWDYNYPINDSRFFIATAYDQKNPNLSATHEHIDDKSLNLLSVLEKKQLNTSIFDDFVSKHILKQREKFVSSSPLAIALQKDDEDTILQIIGESQYMKKYKDSFPNYYRYDNLIDLDLTEEQMIELLELGYDYSSIASTAKGSVNYGNTVDNDEEKYMYGYLDDDNKTILLDIARKIGAKEWFNSLNDEGKLAEFLKKYNMDKVIDKFLEELGNAQDNAQENACQELIDKIPFNVSNATFKLDEMLDYYIDNELTAATFDQLIDQIKSRLPDFSYDQIYDARYTDLDTDQLNREIQNMLSSILIDIEIDEDNPYHQRYIGYEMAENYFDKAGYKKYKDGNNYFYVLDTIATEVTITNIDIDVDEDDNVIPMITAVITPKNKQGVLLKNMSRRIKVPISSLPNYVDQKRLPLKEHLSLSNIVTELFESDHIYPFWTTEDEIYKSPHGRGEIRSIRYEFITKDDVTYYVLLNIWKQTKEGRIDFYTQGKNYEYTSFIQLINTHDAIKVFNTIKAIIESHSSEIKTLLIGTIPERLEFYKNLFNHLGIKTSIPDVPGSTNLIAHINEDLEYEKASDASPNMSVYKIGKEIG